MGSRGPLPMPDNVRKLRGETRPSQQSNQPMPVRGVPSQPSFLSAEARAEWRRITPELSRLQLLAFLDRAILTSYCEAWSELVAAIAAKRENPDPVACGRWKSAVIQHAALATALGLTPNARGRMKAPPQADDAADLD